MTQRLILFFFTFPVYFTLFGQTNPNKDRLYVLSKNRIGKNYIFNRSKPGNYDSTVIRYLGRVTTKKGIVFKIITSKWYFGFGPHATTRVVVFNHKNEYLGNYQLTMTYDLPDEIQNNRLVFSNKHRTDCNRKLMTRVSFNNGIPKQIFINCKDGYGDVNYFGDE